MKRRNRTLIISVGLCMCLCLMVAYAAFQTQLNINGTSSISSNWQVEITDVVSQNIVGSAANDGEPVFSPTAVTFKTTLQKPGDSIDYVVTVTNNGTISAILDNIDQTATSNPAINYIITDINEGDILDSGDSKKFTVTVEYDDAVTTQPEVLSSSLTVALDFVQNK